MSRREIRRMLMGPPRKRLLDRPWAIPALMVLVLVGGVAAGIGIGLVARPRPQSPPPPAAREDSRLPVYEEPLATPDVQAPPPRPSGSITGEGAREEALASIPPAAAPAKGIPAWVRYAVPARPALGRPMIAVVIDDLGLDKRRTERVTTLRAPLTLSFMTYAEDLDRQTALARSRGHELMVHMPMQPMNSSYDAGPDVLLTGLPAAELRRRIDWGLSRFKGFVGINNHMGSRFTADPVGMAVVMEEMRRRGLLFLDSVTTGKSVAGEMARRYGVPFAAREVFLDNDQSVAAVRGQLDKVEALARRTGAAIAIGHPHDATIEALGSWLPALERRGFVLVPVTALVKEPGPGG